MILSSGFPNFTLSAIEHRFHRGTDVPKNGAAQPPATLAAFCDIAKLIPLHQCQQVIVL